MSGCGTVSDTVQKLAGEGKREAPWAASSALEMCSDDLTPYGRNGGVTEPPGLRGGPGSGLMRTPPLGTLLCAWHPARPWHSMGEVISSLRSLLLCDADDLEEEWTRDGTQSAEVHGALDEGLDEA